MHEELMEQVVTQENATAAWLAVKRNEGAPGIDGMTTKDAIRSCLAMTIEAAFQPPDASNPHVRWCGRVPGRNPRHST